MVATGQECYCKFNVRYIRVLHTVCYIREYYATLGSVGAVEHDAVNLSVSIKYPLLP